MPVNIETIMIFGKTKKRLRAGIFIGLLLMQTPLLSAQIHVAPDRYRIEFTDKKHNDFSIDSPRYFLSERALQRREKQGIRITTADLPVSRYYTDSLAKINIEVLHTSRWFNSAIVRCSTESIEKLKKINFIKHTSTIRSDYTDENIVDTTRYPKISFPYLHQKEDEYNDDVLYAASSEYYGQAADQIGMMNGQCLHERGFRGKGMLIAVIDGGFYNAEKLSGFNKLRREGRLRPIKNFTVDGDSISEFNNHGTNVLSIIAADLPGQMVGSAPDADYVLIRSEEFAGEYLVEEDNWIAAAEYADSTGADIITSSLGYSVFDDESQNHVYGDLDGQTLRMSRAAAMAAARGMIVCVSAGNDGDTFWKYISVPADADSIVTVGAVDRTGLYAPFSSVGLTADGRIKPDLTATGKGTAYQNSRGNIVRGNGTSYATPLLAGLMACLWQAFPDKGNMEIIEMVKQSANRYHEPDVFYGYGIPDFSKLMEPTDILPEIADKIQRIR